MNVSAFLLIVASLCAPGLAVAGNAPDVSKLPAPARLRIQYARDIKPLLEANCTGCHGAEKAKGKYRLDTREAAIKGGSSGDMAIIPGKSESSPMIHFIAQLVPEMEMPPKDSKGTRPFTAEEISLIRAWIDQGAKY